VINFANNYIILHNLSFTLGAKIKPIDFKVKPYLILGLRGDYLLGYQDFEIEIQDKTIGIYKSFLDEYEKFVLSGIFGVGIAYNDLTYIDFEYNPALTKNFDEYGLSIKDRYFGVTLGLNINKLIKMD
jgi:hypothetical protein